MYDGGFYYRADANNGLDKSASSSASTYRRHAAYITFTNPTFVKNVLWDISSAGTFTLKIATVSYGDNVVVAQTADVSWTVNKILSGVLYFEMSRNSNGKFEYSGVAGNVYSGPYFQIPGYSYWDDVGSTGYSIPARLIYRTVKLEMY